MRRLKLINWECVDNCHLIRPVSSHTPHRISTYVKTRCLTSFHSLNKPSYVNRTKRRISAFGFIYEHHPPNASRVSLLVRWDRGVSSYPLIWAYSTSGTQWEISISDSEVKILFSKKCAYSARCVSQDESLSPRVKWERVDNCLLIRLVSPDAPHKIGNKVNRPVNQSSRDLSLVRWDWDPLAYYTREKKAQESHLTWQIVEVVSRIE